MGDRYEEGLAMRRQVLGDAYVQRSLEAATEFSRPMQELVTEYCWGAVWARPGLVPRDRSLVNLGMPAALDAFRIAGAVIEEHEAGGEG